MKDGKIKAYLAQRESERQMKDDREVRKYIAYFFCRNANMGEYREIWAKNVETAWKTAEEEFDDYKYEAAKIDVPYINIEDAEDEYQERELKAKQERLNREFFQTCEMSLVEA